MGDIIQFSNIKKNKEVVKKHIHESNFVEYLMNKEEIMAILTISSEKYAGCEFETDMIGWFSLKNLTGGLELVMNDINNGEYVDSPEIVFLAHIFEIEALVRIFSEQQIVLKLTTDQSFFFNRFANRLTDIVISLSAELRKSDKMAMLDKLNLMLAEWKMMQAELGIESSENL